MEQSTILDSVNKFFWNLVATLKNSEVTPHKTLMASDLGHTEADTSFWHLCFRCVKPGYSCHVIVFNIHFASVVGRYPVNRLHYFLSRFQDLLRNLTYIIEFLLISVRSLYEKATLSGFPMEPKHFPSAPSLKS